MTISDLCFVFPEDIISFPTSGTITLTCRSKWNSDYVIYGKHKGVNSVAEWKAFYDFVNIKDVKAVDKYSFLNDTIDSYVKYWIMNDKYHDDCYLIKHTHKWGDIGIQIVREYNIGNNSRSYLFCYITKTHFIIYFSHLERKKKT